MCEPSRDHCGMDSSTGCAFLYTPRLARPRTSIQDFADSRPGGEAFVTLRIASWRGILPRAALLAASLALVPLPVAAADGAAAHKGSTIQRSMERIVARDLASAPASASRVRPARQGQNAGASSGFFKTTPGVVALVVMAAGAGYAVYSASHDRIHSPGKQ
jgi:hypothetical protein